MISNSCCKQNVCTGGGICQITRMGKKILVSTSTWLTNSTENIYILSTVGNIFIYIYSKCHIHIYIYVTLKKVYDRNVVNKYLLLGVMFVTLKKVYDRNVVNKYLLLAVIIYYLIDYIYIYMYIYVYRRSMTETS